MTLAIHIGYHKTATTWLQRRFFVPEMGFVPLLDHGEIDRLIIQPHDLYFDPKPARSIIRNRQETAPRDACSVVSSEILSGHPFYGGRQSASIARRLQSVAPDAHIIVTVRSQETMLPSVYMQYLQRGGTQNYKDFFAGEKGFGYPGFELQHFQYDRLINLYQRLFEKVHVITYEQLSSSPTLALSCLGAALGHPVRGLATLRNQRVSSSLPQRVAPILRKINQTRKSTLNPTPAITLSREPGWMYRALTVGAGLKLVKPFLTTRPVSSYVASHLSGSFSESNIRLDEITGGKLDLSAYP